MRCPVCGNQNREEARFCDACGATLAVREAGSRPEPDGTSLIGAAAAAERADELPAGAPESVGEGRYRLLRFLGEGARKRVYLAEDVAGRAQVAVSLFDTEGVATAVQARARREAEAMQRLGDHPRAARVPDPG